MEFVGRNDEINELRRIRAFSRTNARFTVITGRRRVGKTQLIQKALTDEPCIYLLVTRRSEMDQCADFLEKNGFAYNETTEKYIYRHKDHSFDIMIEYSLSSHLLAVEKVSFPLQSFNVEKIYKKCEHLHVLQQTLRLLDIPVLIRP